MKKTPYLKTLYLQKPLMLILLIAALATLPWLSVSSFMTPTEASELAVIQSFLKSGDISLLNTFEAHSTISRSLVAGFSYLSGGVSLYILRLPSALSFIAIMGFCFMFFAHRRPVLEAFTSVLILITSFGVYFSSIFYNAYILPSFLIVGGIFELYRWLETRRKWKLVTTWLFWGAAVFELGWLVLVAPFCSFLIYLIVRKKPLKDILIDPLLMAVPALLIGILLFRLLPHTQGQTFTMCRALTNGEFWDSFTFAGKILAPVLGFLPWTFILLVALFVTPFLKVSKEVQNYNYPAVLPLDKVSQYNLLAAIVPFIGFLMLPSSVLSEVFFVVSLIFTAIFLSRFIVHLSDIYPFVLRMFSAGVNVAAIVLLSAFLLNKFHWNFHTVDGVQFVASILFTIGLVVAIVVNVIFLFRRKNLKVLMSTVGLIYALQLFCIQLFPNIVEHLRLLFV